MTSRHLWFFAVGRRVGQEPSGRPDRGVLFCTGQTLGEGLGSSRTLGGGHGLLRRGLSRHGLSSGRNSIDPSTRLHCHRQRILHGLLGKQAMDRQVSSCRGRRCPTGDPSKGNRSRGHPSRGFLAYAGHSSSRVPRYFYMKIFGGTPQHWCCGTNFLLAAGRYPGQPLPRGDPSGEGDAVP